MVQIDIKIDDNRLALAFQNKAGQLNIGFKNLTSDLVNIAHRWVQSEAPRKTGRLKTAVQKQNSGTRGMVWLSRGIAHYWIYVVEGTRPHIIRAKNKKALKTPYGLFKSVKHRGTKANPFVDRSYDMMQGDINQRVNAFERWLTEV